MPLCYSACSAGADTESDRLVRLWNVNASIARVSTTLYANDGCRLSVYILYMNEVRFGASVSDSLQKHRSISAFELQLPRVDGPAGGRAHSSGVTVSKLRDVLKTFVMHHVVRARAVSQALGVCLFEGE